MKQPDSKRYRQDETGQWWYHFGKKTPCRMKAVVIKCEWCGDEFVQSPIKRQDKKPVKHCSRSCGIRHALSKDPRYFLAGKEHSNTWKGGRMVQRGYIMLWSPEEAQRLRPGTKKPYVFEHRLVMTNYLGRDLLPTEQVHHKGTKYPVGSIENKQDNRIENLELWTTQHPNGVREDVHKHCPTCTCFECK